MGRLKRLAVAAACAGALMADASQSLPGALDSGLVGAWATNLPDCKRLFQRRGQLAFRQPVDKFAQAAIIGPQTISLPASTCQIRQASRASDVIKISADCRDAISYTSQTAEIKVKSSSEIVYSPTGDPSLATTLIKCPL